MKKSRLSRHKQDRLVEHFVAGTAARCAASLVGVDFKTSAYYFHSEIIAYNLEEEADKVFSGEIAVDESYFGGKGKGKRGCWKSSGIWSFEAWREALHEGHS